MLMSRIPLGEIIELDPAYDPNLKAPASAWEAAFRQCMRRLASGVSVVTCRSGDDVVGITATSVTSLSMSPPSLLVAMRSASSSLPHLLKARRFSVHLLDEAGQRAADAFAGRLGPAPRRDLVKIDITQDGERLPTSLAAIDCRLARTIPVYTHTLLVGVVENAEIAGDGDPLIYFDGAYRQMRRPED